ncbi:hypothetical protein DCC79_12545, partial [bacterium]
MEKGAAEIVGVGEPDLDHGMAGVGQRVQGRGVRPVAAQPEVHEQAVGPVRVGRAERFVGHRQDPGARLARALGHELLDPHADARDRRRGDERQLVAARRGRRGEDGAEVDGRID